MPPIVQAKNVARMAGAPIAPKPKQVGAMAKGRAKSTLKRFITIGILLLTIAIVAGIVYFVKFYGRQPKDALKKTIAYAYENKYEAFRDSFTSDSITLLEGTWQRAGDPWEHMMDGITPTERPKILGETVKDVKGVKTAEVELLLDGKDRSIHMRQEDGVWKVNINVAIDPRKVSLPPGLEPEILELFATQDDNSAWWEEEEDQEGDASTADSKTKKGFLSKFRCSKFK